MNHNNDIKTYWWISWWWPVAAALVAILAVGFFV
jgi:uncharacterized membrane protein